jgi:hypothetical protein
VFNKAAKMALSDADVQKQVKIFGKRGKNLGDEWFIEIGKFSLRGRIFSSGHELTSIKSWSCG